MPKTDKDTLLWALQGRKKELQKHLKTCHRTAEGTFCGYCDSAECQIDSINDEIKRIKKSK